MRRLVKTIVAIGFGVLLLLIYTRLNLNKVFSYGGLTQMLLAGGGLAAIYYFVIEKWLFKED